MSSTLNGDGVLYDNVLYDQYNTGQTTSTQTQPNAITKIRFGSGSTVDQLTGTPDGRTGLVSGAEMDMGVPAKPDNWYRIFWQTVSDDRDGNISGIGIRVERWTPSSGWNEVLAQGSHASYDNNYGDWYRQNQGIFWVPTHPAYKTEQHKFRLGFHKHNNGQIRFNCSIGNDLRRSGWQNNTYECWEVDHEAVYTTGRMTRF